MKTLATYIGYFMAIVGAVTIIWRVAVSFTKQETTDLKHAEEIMSIKALQTVQTEKLDSLIYVINRLSTSHNELVQMQNAQRKSYLTLVRHIEGIDQDFWFVLLNGLEFDLRYDSAYRPSIKIRKKQ